MSNIFQHDDEADMYAKHLGYRGMSISLLLTNEEIDALVNGKFVARDFEGFGMVIGLDNSFDREFQTRIKKISDDAIAEYEATLREIIAND